MTALFLLPTYTNSSGQERWHHHHHRWTVHNFIFEDYGYSGDGSPRRQALLNSQRKIAIGLDGNVLFVDGNNYRIRKIGTDGIITAIGGLGLDGYSGDGGPALLSLLSTNLGGLAAGPMAALICPTRATSRIRRIGNELPKWLASDEIVITSEDASELFVFESTGKHKRTLHALTGAILYHFFGL